MGPETVAVVNIVLALLDRAAQIGAMISQAQAEKRDLTKEELDQLQAQDNIARAKLDAAIAAAKLAGQR